MLWTRRVRLGDGHVVSLCHRVMHLYHCKCPLYDREIVVINNRSNDRLATRSYHRYHLLRFLQYQRGNNQNRQLNDIIINIILQISCIMDMMEKIMVWKRR